MPCVHEFGIISDFSVKKIKSYAEYKPQKYDLISIEDDDIQSIVGRHIDAYNDIDMINPCIPEKCKGLCLYGITVIPCDSCGKLAELLESDDKCVLTELISLLKYAEKSGSCVIHYGV